jgi:transcriptional regulator with XRE-family HTH domain
VSKPSENAVVRLKRRIADRLDADRDRPRPLRRTQQGLADKIGIAKGTLNELLNGPSSNRGLLAHLDKIADYFGVPPSLLIHRNDTALMEMTADEYRIIRHWRTFPADVQEQIASAFDYFAGLLPEEKAERKIWQRWRRLSPHSRARLENALETAYRAELTAKRATRGSAAAPETTDENRERAEKPPRRTALS